MLNPNPVEFICQRKTDIFSIRAATTDDIHQIMALAEEVYGEMCIVSPDREKIVMALWPALLQENGVCFVVVGPDNEIQGGLLLRTGDVWYSNERVLLDNLMFVSKKYRKTATGIRRAKLLCDAAKRKADELGMPLIIGVFNTERTDSKMRFYASQFGSSVGGSFLYGAKLGHYKVTEK